MFRVTGYTRFSTVKCKMRPGRSSPRYSEWKIEGREKGKEKKENEEGVRREGTRQGGRDGKGKGREEKEMERENGSGEREGEGEKGN